MNELTRLVCRIRVSGGIKNKSKDNQGVLDGVTYPSLSSDDEKGRKMSKASKVLRLRLDGASYSDYFV